MKEHTQSIVAMLGWIIPEPFAIPPILIRVPPTYAMHHEQQSATYKYSFEQCIIRNQILC